MKRPLFFVCLTLVGIIAIYYKVFPPNLPSYEELNGREIILSGQVLQKNQNNLYLSEVSILNQELSNQFPIQSVICYTNKEENEAKLGSTVYIRGKLMDFSSATNPGEFNAKLYYSTLGVDVSIKECEVLWESTTYSFLYESLWNLKQRCEKKLEEYLEEQDAAILKTILLGEKGVLDKDIKGLYKQGGIIHILAISGLHISILGTGLYKLLRKSGIPLWGSVIISVIMILLYGMMTRAGVSAYRAIGMFLIRMLAEIVGRAYDTQTALGVLLLFMVMENPLYLYHSGFLLSFSSVLGICVIQSALGKGQNQRKYREGIKKWVITFKEGVYQSGIAGISVTLATLPVLLMYFYEIPLYGNLLNLIVLPLMPILMFLGIGIIIIPGGIWTELISYPIHIILLVYQKLCLGSEKLPLHNIILGKPKNWQICVYIFILTCLVIGKKRIKPCIKRVAVLLGVILLSIRPRAGLEVTFLDVGQGDCICIQTQNYKNYLVDGGSSSKSKIGEYQIVPFLKYKGISIIDGIFLTHSDEDHVNGIRQIIESNVGIPITKIILPEIADSCKSEAYIELENLIRQSGIPLYYIKKGIAWEEGDLEILCLHPPAQYDKSNANAYSQVLFLKNKDFTILLTGDIEADGEVALTEELVRQKISDVSLLKVAHHGSKNSTETEFLEVVTPQVAIISCGKTNAYGHPHKELIERLEAYDAKIISTQQSGAISIKYRNDKAWTEEFLHP